MKKFNSYFGNKIVIVIKKLSVIIIYIIKVVKYCVWLGYGKMGVLLYYLINKNGEKIGVIKCIFRIKYLKIFK